MMLSLFWELIVEKINEEELASKLVEVIEIRDKSFINWLTDEDAAFIAKGFDIKKHLNSARNSVREALDSGALSLPKRPNLSYLEQIELMTICFIRKLSGDFQDNSLSIIEVMSEFSKFLSEGDLYSRYLATSTAFSDYYDKDGVEVAQLRVRQIEAHIDSFIASFAVFSSAYSYCIVKNISDPSKVDGAIFKEGDTSGLIELPALINNYKTTKEDDERDIENEMTEASAMSYYALHD